MAILNRILRQFACRRYPTIGFLVCVLMPCSAFAQGAVSLDGCVRGKMYIAEVCPGGSCDGQCSFSRVFTFSVTPVLGEAIKVVTAEVDQENIPVTTVPALLPAPVNTVVTGSFSYNDPLPIDCGTFAEYKVIVDAEATVGPPYSSAVCTVIFDCVPCSQSGPGTHSRSQDNYTISPPDIDTAAEMQYLVLNRSTTSETITLAISGNPEGWTLNPPLPTNVTLDAGQSTTYYLTATVPGGTPSGTVNPITFSAEVSGFQSSFSSDTTVVTVAVTVPSLRWQTLLLLTIWLLAVGLAATRLGRRYVHARS